MTPEKLGKATVRRWGRLPIDQPRELHPVRRHQLVTASSSPPPAPKCLLDRLAFASCSLSSPSSINRIVCLSLSNPIVPLTPFKMTRQSLSRATGIVGRGLRTSTTRTALFAPRRAVAAPTTRSLSVPLMTRSRFLSTNSSRNRGILPDSDDPAPPNVQDDGIKAIPANLTDAEYHEVADTYLEVILSELETLADKNESIEVEYSVRPPLPFYNHVT